MIRARGGCGGSGQQCPGLGMSCDESVNRGRLQECAIMMEGVDKSRGKEKLA